MLLIRCAACRTKLWKYRKVGPGEVLRCHKDRMSRHYSSLQEGQSVRCSCGREVGTDRGTYIKMVKGAFTYGGTKSHA